MRRWGTGGFGEHSHEEFRDMRTAVMLSTKQL
jgi:hypothetical protein